MKILLFLLFVLTLPIHSKTESWLNIGSGLNYSTFFLIVLILIWIFGNRQKRPLVARNPLNLPILLFMLITYIHLWVGFARIGTSPFGPDLNAYKRFITPFILFFIIVNTIYEKKDMKILIGGMVFVVFLITLFTLKEHGTVIGESYSKGMRFYIVGLQPNHLGAFFAQYLPLSLGFVFFNKGLFKKGVYLMVVFLGLVALMATFSRGAYLSIILAVLAMVMFAGRRVFLGTIFSVLVVLFILAALPGDHQFIPSAVKERFESIQAGGDRSIEGREHVWAIARAYIAESPIIGHGYGASKYILPIDSHNMYLDIALEAGIFALLLFIWILLRTLWLALQVLKKSEDDFSKAISLGLVGSTIAVMVGNLFGTRFDLVATNGYFTILMGMVTRLDINLNIDKTKG